MLTFLCRFLSWFRCSQNVGLGFWGGGAGRVDSYEGLLFGTAQSSMRAVVNIGEVQSPYT